VLGTVLFTSLAGWWSVSCGAEPAQHERSYRSRFLRHHPPSGDVLWRPVCNDPGCGCDRDPLGPQNPMSWSIRRLVRGAPPAPTPGGSAGQWRPSGVVPIGRASITFMIRHYVAQGRR
jgi:hypothetical protein